MFRTITRILFPIVAAAGITVSAAVPADAVTVDTDTVIINGSPVDFGTNWFLGMPLTGGTLTWDLTNGVVKPKLTGNLYINNAAGSCARMQMSYYAGASFLTTKSGGTVCASSNGLKTWSVNLSPYSNSAVTKVIVRAQLMNANGTWSSQGTQTEYLN